MNVLHFNPHPDDEILGAGGTLYQLHSAGHDVSNWALTLGSSDQQRREQELRTANEILGYQLIISDGPYQGVGSDWLGLEYHWRREYQQFDTEFDLFIAPSPLDGHPAHQAVGRLALALAVSTDTPVWLWGLWADLPLSNLLVPIQESTVEPLKRAVSAHQSQLQKRDWQQLLLARWQTQALLGPGRIFGWQHPGESPERAEMLLEVLPQADKLIAGRRRIVDFNHPLQGQARGRDLRQMLQTASWTERLDYYR